MSVDNCAGCERGDIPVQPTTKYPDTEAVEAFAQISALGREFYHQQVRVAQGQSLPSGLPVKRISLGTIRADEGLTAEIVYGSFHFSQRSLYEPGQPRAFGSTDGWILAIRELPSSRFRPVAYEADFAELPIGLKRPLIERITSVQLARERLQTQAS